MQWCQVQSGSPWCVSHEISAVWPPINRWYCGPSPTSHFSHLGCLDRGEKICFSSEKQFFPERGNPDESLVSHRPTPERFHGAPFGGSQYEVSRDLRCYGAQVQWCQVEGGDPRCVSHEISAVWPPFKNGGIAGRLRLLITLIWVASI